MHQVKDLLWTWLMPEVPRETNREEWRQHGGKWIIFDRREKITALAERLGALIDSGEIEGAKYWNGDPSAVCVYSLDNEKERVWEILKAFGAGRKRVWEYDYALDKNIREPFTFAYSWFSKFRTIFQSYGIIGTLRLIREVLKPARR